MCSLFDMDNLVDVDIDLACQVDGQVVACQVDGQVVYCQVYGQVVACQADGQEVNCGGFYW